MFVIIVRKNPMKYQFNFLNKISIFFFFYSNSEITFFMLLLLFKILIE